MSHKLDLSALSIDDIVEEYKTLHERYEQLKERSEEDAQRLHELKRSLDTAQAAEAYLTQELEHLSSQTQSDGHTADPRVQHESEELRRKYKNLQLEHETLQQDYDAKVEQTAKLKTQFEDATRQFESSAARQANSLHDECSNRLQTLELENAELMQQLEEYQERGVRQTFIVAEKEKTIEVLRDQVSCLEENLRCKRDELEEKLQMLESAQEQLGEANAKIAMLTSAPENNERKGNSLFAEVDDQRQVMKQLLAAQKKSYLQMKKTFTDSEYEIRRLKRENVAMHTELQACSAIFCSADKTYQNKLNERIRQLLQLNNTLEAKLNLTLERLRDLASEKSVIWLDSMLDFCKRETDELKGQLHSMRIQKASLDEQLRNGQQDMARWRFESLKSRCVIIDRENLLTEHKIVFKPMQAMEFDIKQAELQAALPRIATPPVRSAAAPRVSIKSEMEVIDLDTPIKPKPVAESTPESNQPLKELPIKPPSGLLKLKVEAQTTEESNESKELLSSTPLKPKLEPKVTEESNQLKELTAKPSSTVMKPKLEPYDTEESKQALNPPSELMESKLEPLETSNEGLIKVKSDHELLQQSMEPVQTVPQQPVEPVPVPADPQLNCNAEPLIKAEPNKEEECDISLLAAKPQRKGTPIKLAQIKAELADELIEVMDLTPVKPQRKGTPVKKQRSITESPQHLRKGTPAKALFAFSDSKEAAPPMADKTNNNNNVRSILSKERDVFAEESTKKMVQFSSKADIIHHLSPQLPVENISSSSSSSSSLANDKENKPVISRPMSKIIMKRIVVGAKKPLPTLK